MFRCKTLSQWLMVPAMIVLTGCGGCATSGASTQASLPIEESNFQMGGNVQVPAAGATPSISATATRALAAGGAHSIRYLTSNESGAGGATVELIDSDGTVIATTTADADGAYIFESVSGGDLEDAGDSDFTTFYVRATFTADDGSTIVEMNVVSVPDSGIVDDEGDGDLSDELAATFGALDVDPESTTETLLTFQGTGINPLTAGEDDFPDDGSLNVHLLDAVNDALMDHALAQLEDTDSVDDLTGQTMEDAIMTYFVAAYAMIGDTIGEQSGAETLNELFNMDPDSEDATSIESEIAGDEGFSELSETDIEGSLEALGAFEQIVEDLWISDETFSGLIGQGAASLDFFVGAAIEGTTVSEFQAMNANGTLFDLQLTMLSYLDLGALTDTNDTFDLAAVFGKFLDPELILAIADDTDAQGTLDALFDSLFDGNADAVDAELVSVMAAALAANAGDDAFWEQFVSGGEVNSDFIGNLVEFFDLGVESDEFAGFFDGTLAYEWGDFFEGIDYSQDWSSYDAATYASVAGELFDQTAETVDPESCENVCGGVATSGCWCDDACSYYGDCCVDKTDVCGENYTYSALTSAGYDATEWNFSYCEDDEDLDGDGIGCSVDNCVYAYNTDQADSDGDGIGDACDDADGDYWSDDYDNCPAVYNSDQANSDYWNDSDGDACDDDDDGDGIADADDTCPSYYDPSNTDSDANGIGDYCDGTDTDGDGWLDSYDNCPVDDNESQYDVDSDGLGDACDDDDDGDGIEDSADSCPYFYDVSNTASYCSGEDSDYDYWADAYDNCPYYYNYDQADSDSDGVGDSCDDDDDDDGVADYDSTGYPLDNCRTVANADQADSDSDGYGDACGDAGSYYASSYCGDGTLDSGEECDDGSWNGTSYAQCTSYCESDYDYDGYADTVDNCIIYANSSQTDSYNNYTFAATSDGIGDACATYPHYNYQGYYSYDYDADNDGYTFYGAGSYTDGYSSVPDSNDRDSSVH